MSDGKRIVKSDVVILSIKPKRPEFSSDTKYILAKKALQEWDKLDAYYRGQILKLKTKAKCVESKKSSNNKISSHNGRTKKVSKNAPRRRSSSGNQLTELFGDENVPLSDNDEACSDAENKRPHNKKSEKNKSKINHEKKGGGSVEDNYLSVPRDNFLIEFAIGEKKRTPIHKSEPPGFIHPVKVERYKPPIAIGLNGVHIQKILYHKSDGNQQQHPSPTTTVTTPENPRHSESTSPLQLSCRTANNGEEKVVKNITTNKASFKNSSKRKEPISPVINFVALKRKSGDVDNHKPKPNNAICSSEDTDCPPKRLAQQCKPIDVNGNHSIKSSNSVSITDKIIQKAKELPPEVKERERQRKLESQKRKAYALEKTTEQSIMENVDVSMKAMEMIIWTPPLLSPIRSP